MTAQVVIGSKPCFMHSKLTMKSIEIEAHLRDVILMVVDN